MAASEPHRQPEMPAPNGEMSIEAPEEASSKEKAVGQADDEHEEDVVAVGSVAHVVQRAFRSFFPQAEVKPSETPPVSADDQPPSSEELGVVEPTIAPSDQESMQPDLSAKEPTPRRDDHADNPFVQLGEERKRAIKAELRAERARANRLLQLLEERHSEAKRADAAVEEDLRRQGLIVKQQIPLGPSPLRLDEHEVAAAEFGAFADGLLHAKAIVGDYHRRRLERSGNAPPRPKGAVNGGGVDKERVGYLDATHSTDIRTDATLSHHEHHISGVKTFHATSSASDRLEMAASISAPFASAVDKDDRVQPMMKAAELRDNMTILERMQTKLDFIRNPRYADEAKRSRTAAENGSPPDYLHSFMVDPTPPIMFTDYDIGGVYEQSVYIRNRTTLSSRLRVLPPGTIFFSISEIIFPGLIPDPTGLVAPGMHIEVLLRFEPDSRADYRDHLTVQYEGPGGEGDEFIVPIGGRRAPPELSIPLVLQAVNTLVGDASRTEIPCANTGGDGTFWLMTEKEWAKLEAEAAFSSSDAATAAMRSTPSASLRVGPFQLSPTWMSLPRGAQTTLVLDFAPSTVGEQRERIVMVCDNCLVRVFQIVGRGCQLEFAVGGINGVPIDRSISTIGKPERLFFPPDVLVDASTRQTVMVSNETPIDVAFSWRVAADEDPPFTVTPASGVFSQSSSKEFAVAFNPKRPAVDDIAQAKLMLLDVPACSLPGPQQFVLLAKALEQRNSLNLSPTDQVVNPSQHREAAIEGLAIELHGGSSLGEFAIEPAVCHVGGGAEVAKDTTQHMELSLRNLSPAPVRFRWRLEQFEKQSAFALAITPSQGTLLPDASLSISVELTPRCVGPFAIPVACEIPTLGHAQAFERRLLLVGEVARGQLRIRSPDIDFGLVIAGGSAEASIDIHNPSQCAATDWKFVHLVDRPAPLPPGGSVLERSNSQESVMSRQSATTVGNETDRSGSVLGSSRDRSPTATVAFAPESGRLQPGEKLVVRAKCLAGAAPERFRATLSCQVGTDREFPPEFATSTAIVSSSSSLTCLGRRPPRAGGPAPTTTGPVVSARAEIQSPTIFLSTTQLPLGATYLGVPVRRTVELVNVSNLEADFKFVDPDGGHAADKPYSLELTPRQGTIRSKQRLEVAVDYTARQAGRSSAVVACNVRGLPAPLGLEVTSLHKGLVLSYELVATPPSAEELSQPEEPQEGDATSTAATLAMPKLAFGDDVPLGERRTLHVLVRNRSGIEAMIELEPKKFPVAADPLESSAPPSSAPSTASPSSFLSSPSSRAGSMRRARTKATSPMSSKTNGSRRPLLSSAHEAEQRLQSENGRAHLRQCAEALEDRRALSHGLGVAFHVSPSSLRLAPWQAAVVDITCFSNRPGAFVDEIASRASGLPPVLLPTTVTVTGSPLELDRNCVGLTFGKPGSKAAAAPPTFQFGQVCVRAGGAPVAKTMRIANRSPQFARMSWRLAPPGQENHLVNVTLRVDFAARVQLQIAPTGDNADQSAFTVSPPHTVVAPFATGVFRVTMRSAGAVASPRVMLVADVNWLDTDPASSSSNSQPMDEDSSDEDEPSATTSSPRVETQQRTTSTPTATAAGKAITAVRLANTLTRQKPSWRAGGLGAATTAVSKSCLRMLLSADVTEPELFLDKPKRSLGDGSGDLELPMYHVGFTTWSTRLGGVDPAAAAMDAHHRRELQLVNRFHTPLTFRLECSGPFTVFRADSLAPKHPLSVADLPPAHRRAQGESFLFSLPPQLAVRIDLRFDPTRLPPAAAASPLLLLNSSDSQSTVLTNSKGHRAMVAGELRVRFASHKPQTIKLGAAVLFPSVVVSPATYSFGSVHLAKSRRVVLRVGNPTLVPATFTLQHVPLPTPLSRAQRQEFDVHHAKFTDEPSVFTFSIRSAIVLGPTISLKSAGGWLPGSKDGTRPCPLVHSPITIEVVFRPREAGKRYRSRFRFAVDHGHGFEVMLEGGGHLDEFELDDAGRPLERVSALTHSNRIWKRP